MTIIIFEDNPYTAKDMKSELEYTLEEETDIRYKEVANFYQANKCIEKHQNNSECILILDLNIPWVGLSEDELKESNGGQLTGWVWLKNKVLNKPEYDKFNIVVYSAFTDLLQVEASFLSHPKQRRIHLISKDEDGCENLAEAIIKILKSVRGR